MFDIISFGSAVVDVFVDTDISEKGKFMCYPVGEKILLKNLRFDIGGGGTNTSVAFSRFGLNAGFLGKIGDDSEGQTILEMLKKEKVKFLGKIEKNKITGYSIILDSKQDNRTILTYKGINDTLSWKEIKPRKLKTKWLYLSSFVGKSFQTSIKIVEYLSSKGTKIAFNPSAYLIKRKNLKPILKHTEILILNREEAIMLAKNKDYLKKLHSLGPKIVVVTDKNKKIQAYDGYRNYSLIPNKIKVVERTGAGDAFASGFIAAQIIGKSIPESLKLGLKESEAVIKHFGAKNNLLRIKLK